LIKLYNTKWTVRKTKTKQNKKGSLLKDDSHG